MTEADLAVSIIVPTRNEAGNVGALWQRLETALAELPHEVCFVDDSDDATPEMLAALEASHPATVRCLLRRGPERTGGLSTAVVEGLRMARGRFVCVMDSDLQHPPETITAMLAAARDGADLVVASRYAAGGSRSGLAGSARRAVSSAARLLARALFSEARMSGDPLSGFFLCRRELIDGIEFRPVGFKILLELLVCVPGLRVRDVPLRFEARRAGESKASLRQGLLYLDHLRSLFLEVEGSARRWKFGLVGLSGLLIFLPVLAILAGPAHLPPLVAFGPAFVASLAWNTTCNRLWTFADQRRRAGGEGPRRYLQLALLGGLVMLGIFAGLTAAHLATLAAGAIAAVGAMVVNGLVNRRAVTARPAVWTAIAADRGVRSALARLAEEVGADRALLLPPTRAAGGAVPPELLDRVVARGHPALWTEAPSHRHQRRTNIALTSLLLVPVVRDARILGVIVCERSARRAFDTVALELAIGASEGIATTVATMVPSEAPESRPAGAGETARDAG